MAKLLLNGAIETISAQDMLTKAIREHNHRIRQLRKHRSAHRRPGHSTGELEVVIIPAIERLVRGKPMDQYVMRRLDMERLLDLGIGRDEEMDQNQRG